MPFAVVGSNITLTDPETGHRYRGREYPWGCVNIEDKVGRDTNRISRHGRGSSRPPLSVLHSLHHTALPSYSYYAYWLKMWFLQLSPFSKAVFKCNEDARQRVGAACGKCDCMLIETGGGDTCDW